MLQGVVGVLGAVGQRGVREVLRDLPPGLDGVEVRADLLLADNGDNGDNADHGGAGAAWPIGDLLDLVRALEERATPVIFTLRSAGEGGRYAGAESERVRIYRQALRAGARLVDAEWGTETARALASEAGAHLLVSHHDFDGTPGAAALEQRTAEMGYGGRVRAVKLVPTARRLADAVRILEWVAARPAGAPARVGFAMGPKGVPSRILTLARGAPFTYASLERAVAPGQLSVRELVEVYAVTAIRPTARLLGVVGSAALRSLSPHLHNPSLRARGLDAVYVPFQIERFADVLDVLDSARIDGLSVTIPFKEDACAAADVRDARSSACGAANTLVIDRSASARTVSAWNTDFDGVLTPLRRRIAELAGVSVAVIGNGGAARGAVQALLEAGARPVLYYRNPHRGAPVARELGVAGRPLEEIAGAAHRVYLNATPLGTEPRDPSPIPRAVFARAGRAAETIAFDMIYHRAQTAFLDEAARAGVQTIGGREMLVAQGVEQFRRFTGETVSLEEFEANYAQGEALRAALGD